MYAETFGIQSPSDVVENAAKWVQWAQAGIMAGAADNDGAIRYNLDQFWKAKAAGYLIATPTDRSQLERLDTFAQGLWNALETAKIYNSSPSYWSFLSNYIMGGMPVRPDVVAAAANAATAAAGMEAAAQRAQQPAFTNAMTSYAQIQARNVSRDVAGADATWKQPGLSPLGIPLWAWIAGGIGLVLLVKS